MRMVVESRAHSAGSSSVALHYWRLQCTPWHCSLYELYSLSLIHMAPREAAPPVQRPYPRLQLTGPRVSMQPNQGQNIVSLRIWTWHQARGHQARWVCSFSACHVHWGRQIYRGKEKTEMDTVRKAWMRAAKSWDQSAGVFPRSSCLPNFGFCETSCVSSFYLSYFELGFCIFQPKESWFKQQQRDSI